MRILALMNYILIIFDSLASLQSMSKGSVFHDILAKIFRPKWPKFLSKITQISWLDRPVFPGKIGPNFLKLISPIFQARLASVSWPYWPRFPGHIGSDFLAKSVGISQPIRPEYLGRMGLDFQAK